MSQGSDAATLATIGSIIAMFGVAMLFFRIQRELQMGEKGEIVWLPWADWLLIAATLISLVFVIVPVTISDERRIPSLAAGAAAIIVAGYVLAILAHYRIIGGRTFIWWGTERTSPRRNPEPPERFLVVITSAGALGFFLYGLLR